MNIGCSRAWNAGISMVETLVTLVILSLGLLGLAGLMSESLRATMESYQREQALILIQDMAVRMNANRLVASCYAFSSDTTLGIPYLGTGVAATPVCGSGTVQQQMRATRDLSEWNYLLNGVAEKTAATGGRNIGGMVGARGCINTIGTNTYLISVAWQGIGKTSAPPSSLSCGINLYGDETLRRVISITLRIAILN